MDSIREQLGKPLVAGIIGLVVGLALGIFYAWVIDPVEYVGAGPADMRPEEQERFLRMAIEAFGNNRDAQKARNRFEALGEDADAILQQLASNPAGINEELVREYAAAVAAPVEPGIGTELPPVAEGEVEPPPEEEPAGGFLQSLWVILCVVVLVVAAAGIVFFIARNRGVPAPATLTPAVQAQQAAREAEWTDYTAVGEEPPLAQFMASYKIGDDLFDDSFSIDSPAGEFLGECGVGISETIGVGDPKKVTAFEVWLFDKNDIQTVTKVLMSEHAYSDETTRQRLEAKGEPVPVEPGTETVLETETLQLVARVVDMNYGEGALPPQSFFDSFILELAVWSKPQVA